MPQAIPRSRDLSAFAASERLERTLLCCLDGIDIYRSINALAESFNGLYKWELIYPRGPWRGLDDVEFATLGYVDWFNHRRLHGEITDDASYTTPAEFEAAYYLQTTPALVAVSLTGEQS